jgi:uncharacterized protein
MKNYKALVGVLLVVGALNWGLMGLMGLNLVSTVLGVGSMLERVVYVLVGLAGVLAAWDMWGTTGNKRK